MVLFKFLIEDLKSLFYIIFRCKCDICFFNENNFTFKYLEYYVVKKRKKKILIITFKKIIKEIDNAIILNVYTDFFKQLIFLVLDVKLVYTTTPGINETIFKKSILNKKTKYLYIQHSPVSLTNAYKEKTFNNYNYIQVINNFQLNEVNEINEKFDLNIRAIKTRYHFIDKFNNENFSNKTLIAPTWGTDFYHQHIIEQLVHILEKRNIDYVFRPHYMSLKKNEFDLIALKKIIKNIDLDPNLNLGAYSNLISDWSGIYLEFCLIHKKKCFLINTSQKNFNDVMRSNTIEETLRQSWSNNYDTNDLENLVDKLESEKNNEHKINLVVEIKKYFY